MNYISAEDLITKVDLEIKSISSCENCLKPGICQNAAPLCKCFDDYISETSGKFIYACPKFRYGHICKYFLSHKHDISSLLQSCDSEIGSLPIANTLQCSSIGGGPGTDYIGIMEWLSGSNLRTQLTELIYNNCDRVAWIDQFKAIREYYEPSFIDNNPAIRLTPQLAEHKIKGQVIIASYVLNEFRKDGKSSKDITGMLFSSYIELPAILCLNDFADSNKRNLQYFKEIEFHLKSHCKVKRLKFHVLDNVHCSDKFPDSLIETYKPVLGSRSLQMALLLTQ